MAFARGKKSLALSDRSGQAFPYVEMVKEWNGSLVHTSEYEPKHPQLDPKPRGTDPEGLLNARPDRTETAVPRLLPLNPFSTTASSTTVTVFEPDNGRSNSDVVRFRDAENVGGVTEAIINDANGYVISNVSTNTYTFTLDSAATETQKGGGGSASAGPVTITN